MRKKSDGLWYILFSSSNFSDVNNYYLFSPVIYIHPQQPTHQLIAKTY